MSTPPFGSSSYLENYLTNLSAGPAPGTPTVVQHFDQSIYVFPLSAYGLQGDDSIWINYALSLLSPPGNSGPTVVRLMAGGVYNIQHPIGLSNWVYGTYLDLNWATLNWVGGAQLTPESACIDFQGQPVAGNYPTNYPGGGFYNGTIITNAAVVNPVAARYGSTEDFKIYGIRTYNMQAGSGVGLLQQNNQGFTEKCRVQAEIWNYGTQFQADSPDASFPSHEYNVWDLHLKCFKSQTGMRLTRAAYTSGSKIHIYGNFHLVDGTPDGNSCIDLTDDEAGYGPVKMSYTAIDLEVETTDNGSYSWETIAFGGKGQMVNSWGGIRFVGGGWTASDATSSEFTFGGVVYEAGMTNGLVAANDTAPSGWPPT